MLNALTKTLFRRAGLDIRKRSSIPFGVDPYADIAALGSDIRIAFDVGANEGQTARKMLKAFPEAQIYSFEPVPSTFARLQASISDSNRFRAFNCAFGASSGTAEMTDGPVSGQNTMSLSAKPTANTVEVSINTVDKFAKAAQISNIDVLKIDTEGFEIPVLQGAEELLKRNAIRFVLAECEFEKNRDQPHGHFFDICDILTPLGYKIASLYTGGVNGSGWVWGDVLFMLPKNGPVRCSPHR